MADDESRRRIPHLRGDARVVNFYFTNGAFAHTSLQSLSRGKFSSIIIDNYTLNSTPNGASANEADLVKVLRLDEK